MDHSPQGLSFLPLAVVATVSWYCGSLSAGVERAYPDVKCGSCNCGGVTAVDPADTIRQRIDSVSWSWWLLTSALFAALLFAAQRGLIAAWLVQKEAPSRPGPVISEVSDSSVLQRVGLLAPSPASSLPASEESLV